MKQREYEEDQEAQIRKHWFPNHIAREHEAFSIPPEVSCTIIDWQKPDTGIFAVRYILDRNKLIVTGDIGSAVYSWSERISLTFLAGCGLFYFAEKCDASESGRDFTDWDEESAKEGAAMRVTDFELPADTFEGAPFYSETEFRGWLSAQDIAGINNDFEAMSSLMEAGQVIHPRCIGHWVGLKMTHQQLQAATK